MVRYGIIGCGMMGREHIRNINLLEKAKVTAIVEPNCKMIELVKPLVPEAKLFNKTKDLLISTTWKLGASRYDKGLSEGMQTFSIIEFYS